MFLALFNQKQQETTLQIETRRQCGPKGKKAGGGRRREDRTEEQMLMDAAGDAHLHTRVYTQKLLRTEDQRSFCTKRLLDTEAWTHRGFYTEKSLYRRAFTRRSFYTEKSLH